MTLFLFSGSAETLKAVHTLPAHCRVIAYSEKNLLNVRQCLADIRSERSGDVAFGAKNLSLQRYHHVLFVLMLLAGVGRGALLDENGLVLRYSLLYTATFTVPRLAVELLIALLLVAYTWLTCRPKRSKH